VRTEGILGIDVHYSTVIDGRRVAGRLPKFDTPRASQKLRLVGQYL
jgi:hypothetical protein